MKRIIINVLNDRLRRTIVMASLVLVAFGSALDIRANPSGGTVSQGNAAISGIGSPSVTINQTSANAFIKWQSFNIAPGEITTFNQPSSSSVTWNYINDPSAPSASTINGAINANGYVVLQNPNGFAIGGTATITAHNLIMTTAFTPAINFSGGGPWEFDAPPPSANIINYGKINITGGGSAFLIASDIENLNDGTYAGSISAPGGKIGLYAGEKVLVSTSPDGRGLSAVVTVPQGLVNNQGQLIADAGSIAAQAKTVNQGGLIQANSVQNINGTIELVASDSLNVGANSVISATGDSTATAASPGGFVVLQSGNSYADTSTSIINVSGQAGGQNGIVDILFPGATAGSILSSVGNPFAFLINPYDITLSTSATDTSSSSPNFNVADLASYSQIALFASDDITLNTLWTLTDPGVSATLTLSAGNNIAFENGTGIIAGNNWSVNLTAGTALTGSTTTSGSDGIYLDNSAYIKAANGDITLWAANEIQVGWMGVGVNKDGTVNSGTGSITTTVGGNIDVTATYGDVNTGSENNGFLYTGPSGLGAKRKLLPPYYTVSSSLGGISTADGGNVTINAGQEVLSYLPHGTETDDAGTGAFGSQPGNVTITAGGDIYGHYVLANGVGTITADNMVGSGALPFALSLIDGTWNVNAPNGDIYLQEVRNPNGIFNTVAFPSANNSVSGHLFDYAPDASVNLAGIGVYLTDVNPPRPLSTGNTKADAVPVLYPPILNITAGSGGVTLDGPVTLFPSADQNLTITITGGGSLVSANTSASTSELLMSDSSQIQWFAQDNTFSDQDHSAGVPLQAASSDPVVINLTGSQIINGVSVPASMENIILITSKATDLTVDGNMIGCGFSGQNLHPGDVTSITVLGEIYNQSPYSFFNDVSIPAIPSTDLLPGMAESWNDIFTLAVNPNKIATYLVPENNQVLLADVLPGTSLFPVQPLKNGQLFLGANPGFFYNPATGRLGFAGPMGQSTLSALGTPVPGTLLQPITILHLVNGAPVIDTQIGDNSLGRVYGQIETDTVYWAPATDVKTLYKDSYVNSFGQPSPAPSPTGGQIGYRLGGPGQFDINAGSMELGNTYGILSCGVNDPDSPLNRYGDLASITPSGATVNVTVTGDLDMLTSTIATIGGGDVNVTSTGGSMDLGSQDLFFNNERKVGFGIYAAGSGNVNVTAYGDVDIDGSKIASFNGGNIFVESQTSDVNVGSGGNTITPVRVSFVDPATGMAEFYSEAVAGSGILASTLVDPSQVPGGSALPGNITVNTPQGDIVADLGGILQEALNGNVAGGPTIDLTAGTPAGGDWNSKSPPLYIGNIDFGNSGVIGGAITIKATGKIKGVVISRQNSTIQAGISFQGTVLSGGSADVSASGSVSGTIIGVGGANVSGGSITASVLGQNVSVNGGAATSTLGSSATATSTSQSASQQASQSANQEVASTDTSDDKNKKKQPTLQRIKRVTVILPKAS
jgi:filamentous hemagglutinin family protein